MRINMVKFFSDGLFLISCCRAQQSRVSYIATRVMITLGEGCDPLRAGFPFNGADPSYVRASSFLGAGDRARTGHLQLGRLSLYQMSYSRLKKDNDGVPVSLQS